MRKLFLVLASLVSFAGCAAGEAEETVASTEQGLSARLHCASIDHRYNSCDVDTNGGRIASARVVRQISGSRCEEGRTWGFGRDYIWVDDGCRADFEVRVRQPSESERIQCSSINNNYKSCNSRLNFITDIRVVHQISSTRCEEGRNYGFYDDAIWVDDGCRADFEVRGYR